MPNAASSILRAATRRSDEPLNVLASPTHERFQTCWGMLPHRFYLYRAPGIKDWNFDYAPLPANTTLLPPQRIPPDLDFDLVVSQSKAGQHQILRPIADSCHLPLVSLEHTLPHPQWDPMIVASYRKLRGDVNVFLSDFSVEAWGWGDDAVIVPPGIDADTFTPDRTVETQPFVLSVVNDWKNRDAFCGFNLWQRVTRGLPVAVLGDNPGMSRPARDTAELVAAYRTARVFLNTSLASTCPFTLLEAMSSGAAVCSTATTTIPNVIEDGVNGFCSNDERMIRYRLEQLLADESLARRLGDAARRIVEDRFSFGRMAADWDRVFLATAGIVPNTNG